MAGTSILITSPFFALETNTLEGTIENSYSTA